jgi:hypothetical protein
MTSTIIDRLDGYAGNVAVKAPCRVATIGPVNLYGIQNIDGVTGAARMRVLVKDQAHQPDNGIWLMASGDWVRSPDFDGASDVVGGTYIAVQSGATNANTYWRVVADGPLVITVNAVVIEPSSGNIDLAAQIASNLGPEIMGFAHGVSYSQGTVGRALDIVLNVMNAPFNAAASILVDDGPPIRAAIETARLLGGGQVVCPGSIYKVSPANDDDSNTAIFVPGNVRITGRSKGGTSIVPGADGTTCFRATGLYGAVDNFRIRNPGNRSGCIGISLAPINPADLATRTDVEFNNFSHIAIEDLAEGVILQCGPTTGAGDSYCYYNVFFDVDARRCTRGFWLKAPTTSPGSGCNRNTFIRCRAGETGTNTGLQVDAGDTNNYFACSFEGVQSGTSPNAVPTAVKIAYNTASYGCTHNRFYGLTIEACTRDMDNDNDLTECYGWFHTGSYYSPSGRPLAVDIQGTGMAGIALGTGRPPTCIGDFYIGTGDGRLGATVGVAGEPEVFVDTPGNYGSFTFRQDGVIKWRIGTQATGAQHATIFNEAGTVIGQFRQEGVWVPPQLASPPTYVAGGMWVDSGTGDLMFGKAGVWKTVTVV